MKKIVSKKSNSQSGFSLVELMIVVAIIGILSSIAVPQFQRFIFKARQTEAKTGLTSLYTAEKAFYGEWSEYDQRFGAIGYEPEGKYFYNIGFLTGGYESSNLTGTVSVGNVDIKGRCAATGGSGKCSLMSSASGADNLGGSCQTKGSSDGSVTPSFIACASAKALNPEGGADNWSVNTNKMLVAGHGSGS